MDMELKETHTEAPVVLRPAVRDFARQMERRLREREREFTEVWSQDNLLQTWQLLDIAALDCSLEMYEGKGKLLGNAVDTAIYALILADQAGALRRKPETAQRITQEHQL